MAVASRNAWARPLVMVVGKGWASLIDVEESGEGY